MIPSVNEVYNRVYVDANMSMIPRESEDSSTEYTLIPLRGLLRMRAKTVQDITAEATAKQKLYIRINRIS